MKRSKLKGINHKVVILGLASYALIFIFLVIPWLGGQEGEGKHRGEARQGNLGLSLKESVALQQVPEVLERDCGKRLIVLNQLSETTLGEDMFQYAALLGVAKVNNFKPYLYDQACQRFRKVFLKTNHMLCNDVLQWDDKNIVWEETEDTTYDKDISSMHANQPANCFPMDMNGGRQSWRYFHNYMGEVKEMFTIPKRHLRIADDVLMKVNASSAEGAKKIGVVIEIGDKFNARLEIHKSLLAFVKRAMTFFKNSLKVKPVFIVYMTESWIMEDKLKEIKMHDIHILRNVTEEDALATMTSCDHVIFTSGALGWWSGVLAGGAVVYAQNETFDSILHERSVNKLDYYMPGWIGLD